MFRYVLEVLSSTMGPSWDREGKMKLDEKPDQSTCEHDWWRGSTSVDYIKKTVTTTWVCRLCEMWKQTVEPWVAPK
jgi:hypothetical protein